MGKSSPVGKAGDGEQRGDDAIAKILEQARKEGVRIIEPGSSGDGGIARILRQLGSDNP
jgi:hypothetical protein